MKNWQKTTFFERQPFVLLSLTAMAGILTSVYVSLSLPVWGGCAAFALLFLILLKKSGRRCLSGLGVLCFFLFGLLSSAWMQPSSVPEGSYSVRAIVCDSPKVNEEKDHVSVYLRDVLLTNEAGESYQLSKVYWTYYGIDEEMPEAGREVCFQAKLYHPQGQVNPNGFNFRLYLQRSGISNCLYGRDDFLQGGQMYSDFRTMILSLRLAIGRRLDTLFGEQSAFPKALLLGEREDMPEAVNEAFSKSGIAHVLAVSGLHVGLLAGALLLILQRFVYPRTRAIILDIFLLLYCLLLDFTPSVIRASVMLAVVVFFKNRLERLDGLWVLSLSLLVVLIIQPLELLSNGLILSFGAVLGICFFTDALGERLRGVIPSQRLRSGAAATLGATAGTAIPSALMFHRFAPLSLVVSPLVCLLLGVLLPIYALILLIGSIWLPVAMLLAQPMQGLTRVIQDVILWTGNLSFATLRVPNIPLPFIPFFIALLCVLSPYCALQKRKRGILLLALFFAGSGLHLATIDRALSYTQLSLGNNDSAILQDGRKTVVVDTGEEADDLCSYLLAKGRSIDTLILTHLHADHCLGTLELLEEDIPIGQVILPYRALNGAVSEQCAALITQLGEKGIPVRYMAAGETLECGRIKMTVLWPYENAVRSMQDLNDYSLTILCEMGETRLLLMGDLSGIYDHYAAEKADILKVAHHGGKNETTEAFLSAVQPQIAVVSASGRSGKPSEEVLERLEKVGADAYITGLSGAVRIECTQGGVVVRPFRKEE